MTLYPDNIDDNTSLPPSYAAENIFAFKFAANIAANSYANLLNATTGLPMIL